LNFPSNKIAIRKIKLCHIFWKTRKMRALSARLTPHPRTDVLYQITMMPGCRKETHISLKPDLSEISTGINEFLFQLLYM
jgi:hypothetical protein